MAKGTWRVLLYGAAVISPLLLITLFHPEAGHGKSYAYEVGKNLGLIGFMILVLQVFLTGRFKWVERPFGLDITVRFHRNMAVMALAFLFLHPILMAWGGAGWKLLIGLKLPWYIWAGKIGFTLLFLHVGISLFRELLSLSFERWRLVHDLVGPLLLAAVFLHSFYAGENIEHPPLLWLWPLFPAGAVAAFLHHRMIRPALLSKKPYRVRAVRPEADAGDVWTVELSPSDGELTANYYPGQFHFITFHRQDPDLPQEEHHWTISSSPTEAGFISSTIKALGDFTATIGKTQVGDTATVHGPFGRFSYAYHPEKTLVFIAGGIGVTPLRSMLRHMQDTMADIAVLFLYANKNEEEIVFKEELEKIAGDNRPRFRLVHVLEDPPEGWAGERGTIDREKIRRLCGERLKTAAFYLCGPPGLVENTVDTLKELGVPDRRIRLEIFSFI